MHQGSGPKKRPKERKRQILNRARELFIEYGYPNVTMAKVAEGVGITAGALYRHYTNKSNLLEEVFADAFEHLQDPPEATQDPETMLDEAFALSGEFFDVADLWRSEFRYLPADFRATMRTRLLHWVEAFIKLAKATRPDLDDGQAALIGWAMQSVLAHPKEAVRGFLPTQRATFLKPLLLSLLQAELLPSGAVRAEPATAPDVNSMRERLLLAAIQLFGEQGYRAVSMDMIGAVANVTGPNLYSHFENKADLLGAAYQRGMHSAWIGLERALLEATDTEDAVRRAADTHSRLDKLWTQVRARPMNEIPEQAQRDSVEYVTEWMHLVQQAVPGLSRREANLRVLMAFAIADDLDRTGPVKHLEGYPQNLTALMCAVLMT